jgi:hypothetical protein
VAWKADVFLKGVDDGPSEKLARKLTIKSLKNAFKRPKNGTKMSRNGAKMSRNESRNSRSVAKFRCEKLVTLLSKHGENLDGTPLYAFRHRGMRSIGKMNLLV